MPADAPRRRPTIADVARRAGVSPAAVSFAVNDRPGVGEATRARIQEAIAELGWRPSAAARALTDARARAIGLVLARDPAELEADAFFVRFLAGLERTLAPRDHALVLQLVADSSPAAYERLAASGRVDGFVVTDVERGDPRLAALAAAGIPAVVAGRPDPGCPFPWIETEHERGMAAAVAHLRARGHATVGFLGGPGGLGYVAARRAAWRTAAGPAAGPAVCMAPGERPAGTAARMLATGAPAVAATSDVLALALLAAAREAGASVAVTGFDDSPLAAHAVPGITSVRVDYAAFGAAAAELLLALLDGVAVERPHLPAPALVVRGTS